MIGNTLKVPTKGRLKECSNVYCILYLVIASFLLERGVLQWISWNFPQFLTLYSCFSIVNKSSHINIYPGLSLILVTTGIYNDNDNFFLSIRFC